MNGKMAVLVLSQAQHVDGVDVVDVVRRYVEGKPQQVSEAQVREIVDAVLALAPGELAGLGLGELAGEDRRVPMPARRERDGCAIFLAVLGLVLVATMFGCLLLSAGALMEVGAW